MPRKAFRLTDVERHTRYGIVADGIHELKRKGSEKFPSSHAANVVLALANDGTIIDDDEYLMALPEHSLIMLLKPGDVWQAAPSDNVALPLDEVDGGLHGQVAKVTPAVSSFGSSSANREMQLLDCLRRDGVAGIISFSYDDLQTIASMSASDLSAALGRTEDEASRVQELCHEHALERQAAMESVELLKLYRVSKEADGTGALRLT